MSENLTIYGVTFSVPGVSAAEATKARIDYRDLAALLGYSRSDRLLALLRRHRKELNDFDNITYLVEIRKVGTHGTRNIRSPLLTMVQAMYLAQRSTTEKSNAVVVTMMRAFTELLSLAASGKIMQVDTTPAQMPLPFGGHVRDLVCTVNKLVPSDARGMLEVLRLLTLRLTDLESQVRDLQAQLAPASPAPTQPEVPAPKPAAAVPPARYSIRTWAVRHGLEFSAGKAAHLGRVAVRLSKTRKCPIRKYTRSDGYVVGAYTVPILREVFMTELHVSTGTTQETRNA